MELFCVGHKEDQEVDYIRVVQHCQMSHFMACFVTMNFVSHSLLYHLNLGWKKQRHEKWFYAMSDFRAYFGNLNFFGGSSSTSAKSSDKLRQVEQENVDAMFVFVADLWLDNAKVSVLTEFA